MAVLLKNVTNSIWHAFNFLSTDGTKVMKSKLKVLTANMGTLMHLYGVEKGLDHYRSTPNLNFEHFKYYLQKEVFSSLPDTLQLEELRIYESRIDEVCWLVCKKSFLCRKLQIFPDICVYQLFRIFCLLAEMVPDGKESFKVVLNAHEVAILVSQVESLLGNSLGSAETEGSIQECASGSPLSFLEFLTLLESQYVASFTPATPPVSNVGKPINSIEGNHSVEEGAIKEAISELHDTYVRDVLKKGYLHKKGELLPTLREYWFVLQPNRLTYFKGRTEEETGGEPRAGIPLGPHCRVGVSPSPRMGHHDFRFVLTTGERSYELAAHDQRTRLQWISAFHLALSHCGNGLEGYQRQLAMRRQEQRKAQQLKEKEERHKEQVKARASEPIPVSPPEQQLLPLLLRVEEAKAQLQAEKTARLAAETQARELEDVKIKLEKLLEEETQAKRDEEIVRALQARVLREEWEKREELEKLQDEQRLLLEEEREKRRLFEELQKNKEAQLQDAESKLKKLEEDRIKLDHELESAREKIQSSEKAKDILEAKLRVMFPETGKDGGAEGVRRALSFMSCVRERPRIRRDQGDRLERELVQAVFVSLPANESGLSAQQHGDAGLQPFSPTRADPHELFLPSELHILCLVRHIFPGSKSVL
ncbi:differentially expressed in FDCP 6 homolog [Ischnura elegans]|uniref:differentially expressed in FDCP 6 homolog n=1 Tax=Ischnura elegans TaxID=197161 RepID=UPI001ED89006|nr:differentially expressed in FDCP 6 homolog [Ischnura elegans]